jgi:hypothetical protein
VGGGWVGGVKLKLKLNSAQLKLEFGLSLAKMKKYTQNIENLVKKFCFTLICLPFICWIFNMHKETVLYFWSL